jgi:predicted peptidase
MIPTLSGCKRLFIICHGLALLTFVYSCKKQTSDGSNQNPANQSPLSLTAKATRLSAHCNGFYEYLPEGYITSSSGSKYPLLIFFHGAGEIGSDSTELIKVLKNGPLKHASNGTLPPSFTVNNTTYRFIIIAPQLTSSDNSFPGEVDDIIEFAKRSYKVDPSRIYLTGLSFGAGVCWNYVAANANYAHKIAAVVATASYINEARNEFKIDNGKAHVIAASNLPIWATHNERDNVCPVSWVINADSLVKKSNPSGKHLPKLTLFNEYGHEGWTQTYDPNFRENNLNIYQWMLQYHR